MQTSVLVAADDPLVGSELERLLQSLARIDVVAVVAASGVLDHVVAVRPEIVLLAPASAGDEVLAATASVSRVARLILLAPGCDRPPVTAAIRAGAHGYLLQGRTLREDLELAVRGVANGAAVVASATAATLTSELRSCYLRVSPDVDDALTSQERALMHRLVRGLSNSNIASELCLAPKTVRNYLSRIYSKLGVADRTEAIATWLGLAGEQPQGIGDPARHDAEGPFTRADLAPEDS